MYDNNLNDILVEAMKSKSQSKIVRTQAYLHDYLTGRRFKPWVRVLNNECPKKLEEHLCLRKMSFQLVPLHLHRTNAVERAMVTFKDHLIAELSSTDHSLPMHLWCRLLPQAQTALNLLRLSRINPRISAEAIQL